MAFSLANSWLNELREGSSRHNQDDRSSSDEAEDDEVSQLDLSESDIDEAAVTDFEQSDSEEENGNHNDDDDSDRSNRSTPSVDLERDRDRQLDLEEMPLWTDQFTGIDIDPFQEIPGPRHLLDESSEPLDYFELFVPKPFITHLTVETNAYAEQIQTQKGSKDKYWTDATEDDIRKYLYINIMFGILSLPEQRMYWSKDPALGNLTFEN